MRDQLLDLLAWTIVLITALTLIGVVSYVFYEYIGFDGMLSLWSVAIIASCLIWAFSRILK